MVDPRSIRRLKTEGVGPAEIARRVGVARSGVYRVLAGDDGANGGEGGTTTADG